MHPVDDAGRAQRQHVLAGAAPRRPGRLERLASRGQLEVGIRADPRHARAVGTITRPHRHSTSRSASGHAHREGGGSQIASRRSTREGRPSGRPPSAVTRARRRARPRRASRTPSGPSSARRRAVPAAAAPRPRRARAAQQVAAQAEALRSRALSTASPARRLPRRGRDRDPDTAARAVGLSGRARGRSAGRARPPDGGPGPRSGRSGTSISATTSQPVTRPR